MMIQTRLQSAATSSPSVTYRMRSFASTSHLRQLRSRHPFSIVLQGQYGCRSLHQGRQKFWSSAGSGRPLLTTGCALLGVLAITGVVLYTSRATHLDARVPPSTRTLLSANVPTHRSSQNDTIDTALRHNEKTVIPPLESGVCRYDIVRLSR